MGEQDIITKRIKEVEAERESLRAKLAECDREMAELETAAKVMARLTGAPEVKRPRLKIAQSRKGLPTMPELIVMALKQEKRALEPREIAEVIRRNWWPEVETKKIGSIVWRLREREDIEKVEGTSSYRLPQTQETSDENPSRDTSEVSLSTTDPEAQGHKARPGGGP